MATDLQARAASSDEAAILAAIITGGDERIRPGPDGRNKYFATVTPFEGLAFGSSTISSITADALAYLAEHWTHRLDDLATAAGYAAALDELRARIVALYSNGDSAIVIAASGTDLEYVGLAAAPSTAGPICGILLGRDEVGSGCIHSAAGRFFADRTAIGAAVTTADPIDPRHAANRLVDVPIRDVDGTPRASAAIAADLADRADEAIAAGEHPVIHVVHGSKTGLTLPSLDDCAVLSARFGLAATIVVDACQLRISPAAVRAYLDLGCVVLATGSKSANGAPFSGFALVPHALVSAAAPLTDGYRLLARSAEWPAIWPGRDRLADESNPGLALRLAGALFEIERFSAIDEARVVEMVDDFCAALATAVTKHGLALLPTDGPDGAMPACLAATLATLDMSQRWPMLDFDAAGKIHHALTHAAPPPGQPAFRVGQPVRARRLAEGHFAATLRLSLSMPMMVEHSALDRAASQQRLAAELDYILGTIAARCAAA